MAWNYTPGAVEHAPAIADNGLVYVNTLRQSVYKGLDAGGNPIYVAGRATTCAFDAATLEQIWETEIPGSKRGTWASDNSPIIGHNNRIYTGFVLMPGDATDTSAPVVSMDALTGEIKSTTATSGWIACPGVIDEDGHVYYGAEDAINISVNHEDVGAAPVYQGNFLCFDGADPASGIGTDPMNLLWSFHADGDFGSPVGYCDGIVYSTCRDGHLYGFEKDTGAVFVDFDMGTPSWTGTTIGRMPSGNPVLYTATHNAEFITAGFTDYKKSILAIEVDAATGNSSLLWEYESKSLHNGFSFGNPLLDDQGNLYFNDGGGFIYSLRADTGAENWFLSTSLQASGVAGPTMTEDGLLILTRSDGIIMAIESNGNHVADDLPWPKYKRNMRATGNLNDPIRELFYLERPELIAGAATTLTVHGMQSIRGYIAYSLTGPGYATVAALGYCFNNLDAARLLTSVTRNPVTARGTYIATVPAGAAGLDIYMQAFEPNQESMVMHCVIQ
ncbi:MAG: PQQ-binding-like beta-propeller repeat protein [Planctomycetes bacterium]|nr:PQQ-binding-like beta-propeller repeat protein [Planctomycetota bacterium]